MVEQFGVVEVILFFETYPLMFSPLPIVLRYWRRSRPHSVELGDVSVVPPTLSTCVCVSRVFSNFILLVSLPEALPVSLYVAKFIFFLNEAGSVHATFFSTK